MKERERSIKSSLMEIIRAVLFVALLIAFVLVIWGVRKEENYVRELFASDEDIYTGYAKDTKQSYKDALSLLGYSSDAQTYLFHTNPTAEYTDISHTLSAMSYISNSLSGCQDIFLISNAGKEISTTATFGSNARLTLFHEMLEEYSLLEVKPQKAFFTHIYYLAGEETPYFFYVQRMTNIINADSSLYLVSAVLLDFEEWSWHLMEMLSDGGGYVIDTKDARYALSHDGNGNLTVSIPEGDENQKYLTYAFYDQITGWEICFRYPGSSVMWNLLSGLLPGFVALLFILLVLLSIYISLNVFLKQLISSLNQQMQKVNLEEKLQPLGLFAFLEFSPIMWAVNHMLDRISVMAQKEADTQIRLYQAVTEQKLAEIKALRLQLNAHFLFNTLSTVNSLAVSHNDSDISDMVQRLANIFHYVLFTPAVSELASEVDMALNYAEIMEKRFPYYHKLQLDISEEAQDWPVPTMFLQPLVENSFEHGHKDMKKEQADTKITAYVENDFLIVKIWDNGCGISGEHLEEIMQNIGTREEKKDKKEEITLKNIYHRFSLIYSSGFAFQIRSEIGEYTEVELQIPMLEPEVMDRMVKIQHIVV